MRRFLFKLLLISLAVLFWMTLLACALEVSITFLAPYIGKTWAGLVGGVFTVSVFGWAWFEVDTLIGKISLFRQTRR